MAMHIFQLKKHIQSFFDSYEKFQPFIISVADFSRSASEMEVVLQGIANLSTLRDAANQAHAHLNAVPGTLRTITQRQFFKALEDFKRALHDLQPYLTARETFIAKIDSEVEDFSALYDTFISNHSVESALPLLIAAKALDIRLATFLGILQYVEQLIDENDVASSAEAPLSLYMPAPLSLSEFAHKLLAIQELYSELCMLLSVSEATYPLRVSKIESGSMWVKLFGDMRVVGMLASFIENTASWLFRSYTTEGKLAAIPRKVEAIDAILGLSKRLTEAGLDATAMKDHIEKSAIMISQSLTQLLDGESSITINDHIVSVNQERRSELLPGSANLQLTGTTDTSVTSKIDPPLLN